MEREQIDQLVVRLRARTIEPGVQMRWAEDFKAAADAIEELLKPPEPVAPPEPAPAEEPHDGA